MEESRKKQILLIAAAVAAIISLLAGWYFTLRKGVYVGEKFFYKISTTRYEQNDSNYIEQVSDSGFEIVSDTGKKTVSVKVERNSLIFAFSDGTSLTGVWDGVYLTDSEGLPVGWDMVQISVNEKPIEVSNATYCQALCRIYYGKEETISKWYIQVVGILIYLLGIVSVLYPDEVHFFLIKWKYNNPELSETGRLLEQIGGVMISVMGIGITSGVLLMFVR